jgi:hypothetical protein
MGVLDQLRNEATIKQQSEFSERDTQQQLDIIYRGTILPRMQKIFIFLKEVVEHLAYLEKAIEIVHYSRKFPDIGVLIQQDYQINTDNYGGFADFENIKQINVNFVCIGRGSFNYVLDGRNKIEDEVAFLNAKNMTFDWNQFVNQEGVDAANFTVTRKIPVRFRFEADIKQSRIKLLINNHEDFSVYNKKFDPNAMNEEFLDEVIRLMLRRESDFIRLDINNQDKYRIQKRAEALQIQQAQWLNNINIKEDLQPKKEKSPTIFSRINLFGKRKN